MLYYLIRRSTDKEPLALVRINAKEHGYMNLSMVFESRFGSYVRVDRNGRHVYNIILGDNQDVIDALDFRGRADDRSPSGTGTKHGTNYRLEQVDQAEWETFEAFDLFPILKVAVAR